MTKALPSQARLRELFTYEPHTGALVRRVTQRRWKAGTVIGHTGGNGYQSVEVDGNRYYTHRLIWMYVHGEDPGDLQVDHKDLNRLNNRIENLRLATNQQNQINVGRHKDRTNDLPKCVYLLPSGKYQAKINNRHIGCFDIVEEAQAAYVEAAETLHGSFARAAA